MTLRYKPGSRVQQVWEVYEKDGPEAAAKFGASLNLAPTTLKSWNRMWAKGETRTSEKTTQKKADAKTALISAGRRRVCCTWWPERPGVVIKAGEEMTEVRWDTSVPAADGGGRTDYIANKELIDFKEKKDDGDKPKRAGKTADRDPDKRVRKRSRVSPRGAVHQRV